MFTYFPGVQTIKNADGDRYDGEPKRHPVMRNSKYASQDEDPSMAWLAILVVRVREMKGRILRPDNLLQLTHTLTHSHSTKSHTH